MLTYLDKFNSLPQDIRDKVSTPEVMNAISELENKYGVSLAAVVMRVMVKDVSVLDLPKFFVFEFAIDGKKAQELTEMMKEKVFFNVSEYLGIIKEEPTPADEAEKIWEDAKANEAAIRSSAFFFSTEDEEEVKELATKLAPAASVEDKSAEYEGRINETIAKLNLHFSSEELLKRYRNILTTYLRGVRNKVNAKEALAKGIDAGGLSMEMAKIDSIFLVLDKIPAIADPAAELPKPPVKIKLPEDKQMPMIRSDQIDAIFKDDLRASGVRDVDYDFSKLAAKSATAAPETGAPSVPSAPAVAAAAGTVAAIPASAQPVVQITPDEKQVAETVSPAADNAPTPDQTATSMISSLGRTHRRGKTDLGKVRMDDVKPVTKLMGPLDELREMDVISFRRLNEDPSARAAMISEKIHFLEEESFAQRLAGIKAWRQSPVNKLYLDIGQESMNIAKPVEFVIEKRRTLNEEHLSPPEFEAIMELNRSLRY